MHDLPSGAEPENQEPEDFAPLNQDAVLIAEPVAARPRVWTVFLVAIASLMIIIIAQACASLALVAWLFMHDTAPKDLPEKLINLMANPGIFILLALIGQLVFAVVTLFAACWSPEKARTRLNWQNPHWPVSRYGLFVIASFFPATLGMAAAHLVALWIAPDPTVEALYENMNLAWAALFIAFIALAPGFAEELFFRGYCQRRLLQRWSPRSAIGVTSILFALFHVTPHAIVFAFPLGIWLGVLAWRANSIWPGIACHVALNGLWNVFQIGVRLADVSDNLQYVVLGVTVVAGLVAFTISIRVLKGLPSEIPAMHAEPDSPFAG